MLSVQNPILIAGPCVIESEEVMSVIAETLAEISQAGRFSVYFKASFDKANRTSYKSYRGPGLDKGLESLMRIKKNYNLRIVTDIHESWQAKPVAEVADVIQIPAFLSRQTDLIQSAAKTGKIVNIKKGQFLSGNDMRFAVEKARVAGAENVFVTERGNSFGYNNLVVDFRNISLMKDFADKVIMDCTHSVQLPGASDGKSGGEPKYIQSMALAAKAFGADGYFFEVHPEPEKSLSDSASLLQLNKLSSLLEQLQIF